MGDLGHRIYAFEACYQDFAISRSEGRMSEAASFALILERHAADRGALPEAWLVLNEGRGRDAFILHMASYRTFLI